MIHRDNHLSKLSDLCNPSFDFHIFLMIFLEIDLLLIERLTRRQFQRIYSLWTVTSLEFKPRRGQNGVKRKNLMTFPMHLGFLFHRHFWIPFDLSKHMQAILFGTSLMFLLQFVKRHFLVETILMLKMMKTDFWDLRSLTSETCHQFIVSKITVAVP